MFLAMLAKNIFQNQILLQRIISQVKDKDKGKIICADKSRGEYQRGLNWKTLKEVIKRTVDKALKSHFVYDKLAYFVYSFISLPGKINIAPVVRVRLTWKRKKLLLPHAAVEVSIQTLGKQTQMMANHANKTKSKVKVKDSSMARLFFFIYLLRKKLKHFSSQGFLNVLHCSPRISLL